MNYLKSLSILAFTMLIISNNCFGQSSKKETTKTTVNNNEQILQIDKILQVSEIELLKNNFSTASKKAEEAVALSQKISYNQGYIKSHLILGKINRKTHKFAPALNYLLQALKKSDSPKDNPLLAKVYNQIGLLYYDYDINEKAIEYFIEALLVSDPEKDNKSITKTYHLLAHAYLKIRDYKNALLNFNEELNHVKKENDKKEILATLLEISDIYKATSQHQKSLDINLEILEVNQQLNDSSGIVITLNNIGFLYGQLGEKRKSLEYFLRSLKLNKKIIGEAPSRDENIIIATFYRNVGVLYQNLDNYENALNYFQKALKIEETDNNYKNIALTCNYIASSYYVKEMLSESLKYCNKAVENAQKENALDILSMSYKRIAQIYKKQRKFKDALKYFQMHTAMKDSAIVKETNQQQINLKKLIEAEKKEQELKLLLVEKEVKDLALIELELKSEKKQQEYELLLRDKELQEFAYKNEKLNKARAIKELELTQQKLVSEKKEQKILALHKDNAIKNLALKQKELEKQQQKKATKFLERENELQNLKLQEERAKNAYFMFSIIGTSIIIILIIIGYLTKRRDHRRLSKQHLEIEIKNTELKKQKQAITIQNQELEQTYNNIKTLSEIGQKITASLDIASICKTVYNNVQELMPAECFGIGIYDKWNNRIDFKGFMEKGEELPYHYDSLNDFSRLSVVCFKKGMEMFMNDFHEEYYECLRDSVSPKKPYEVKVGELPESLVYLPLEVEGKTIGVLTVQSFSKNAYTENHLVMLRTLSIYIAIAIDNANAYNIIRQEKKKITDSIIYAEKIQQAILVSEQNLKTAFSDCFILFKPKDIVSGDFYWYSKLENQIFIAAIDCTGHGVPGAFMSMIGNTLLNEIINEKKVYDPKEILKHLDAGVRLALKQDSSNNVDGMELSLCRIENGKGKDYKITFSGAKGITYYYSGGELKKFKGERIPVGGFNELINNKKDRFTNHQVKLKKGDSLFLTTDGFIDTANNERKRFGYGNFKAILTENLNTSSDLQKLALNEALEDYQGITPQRDDITVIGIKL